MSVASVMNEFLIMLGITKSVHCLWQLSGESAAQLSKSCLPSMSIAECIEMDRRATDDWSQWTTRPVYLARHEDYHFILDARCTGRDPEAIKRGEQFLHETSPLLRYLLAKQKSRDLNARLLLLENLQDALFQISTLVTSEREEAKMFEMVHAIIKRLCYADNLYIVKYNEDRQSMQFLYFCDTVDNQVVDSKVEFNATTMPNSLTLAMLKSRKYAWGATAALEESFGLSSEGNGPSSIDWMGIPVIFQGRVIGGLVIQSYLSEHHYSQNDLRLMKFLAEHIQSILRVRDNEKKLEELVADRTSKLNQEIKQHQQTINLQNTLYEISDLAISSKDPQSLYSQVHRIIGNLIDARNFYVAFPSKDGNFIEFTYNSDETGEKCLSRPSGKGLTEYAIAMSKPLLMTHDDILEVEHEGLAQCIGTRPQCWLSVPIIIDKSAPGLMVIQSYTDAAAYGLTEQKMMSYVSNIIGHTIKKIEALDKLSQLNSKMDFIIKSRTAQLEQSNQDLRHQIALREHVELKLKYDAAHDELTGLASRKMLHEKLQQSLARHAAKPTRIFSLFFLDLDRFKIINDSMGHWAGDRILKLVGERLVRCVRNDDLVARLGGDEFAIILNSVRNKKEIKYVADRMLHAISQPYVLDDKELFLSCSIGIVTSQDRHHLPEEVLRDADTALYRSKDLGRNLYTFFDESLHQAAVKAMIIESDLRRSLSRDEFFAQYQPVFSLTNGNILGFEALMRWQHPTRGLLYPSDFMTPARDSGIIATLDWKIYEKVCQDLPNLLVYGDFVSINVSPQHFRDINFSRKMLKLLAKYHVDPHRLTLEVTEDAFIDVAEDCLGMLNDFRAAGMKISLDDFGTGYSSLSYLYRLPLDSIKIEQSFIASLNNDTSSKIYHLIAALKALADSLQLNIIAEGVETTEQADCLETIGINVCQGNLLSGAVSVERISQGFSYCRA